MTPLDALIAAEQAAALRLKTLTGIRDSALAAMEHANTLAICALSSKDLERLVHDTFHVHLAKALHSQFYMLIDEAQHTHWLAKIALEQFEDEAAEGIAA